MDQDSIVCLAVDFVSLQEELLAAWFAINSRSRDLHFLLDFPKSCVVMTRNREWSARRHGVGVRFCDAAGMTIDVPSDVGASKCFEAGRLFDYGRSLQSAQNLQCSICRSEFSALFDAAVRSGLFVMCQEGRTAPPNLYKLPSARS